MLKINFTEWWPVRVEQEINAEEIRKQHDRLLDLYNRCDDYRSCFLKTIEEPEADDLPMEIITAIEHADERTARIMDWLDSAADALDDMLGAVQVLEDNASFVFIDVPSIIKKGGRK